MCVCGGGEQVLPSLCMLNPGVGTGASGCRVTERFDPESVRQGSTPRETTPTLVNPLVTIYLIR